MPQYMLVFCLFVCVFECFLHIQNVANLKKKATLKKKSLISSSNIYLGDFVFSFSSLPTIGGVTHNSLPFQSASFPLTEHVGDFLCRRRTQVALPYPSHFTPNLAAYKVKIVSCKTRYPCPCTFKSFKLKSFKRSLATQTIL